MCISGHQDIDFGRSTGNSRTEKVDQARLELGEGVAEPQSHISRYLIISRSSSVQFAGDVGADDFSKTAFVGSMNVFINGWNDFERAGFPLLANL